MTFEEWGPLYGYLCAGLSRKADGKQGRVYFDALAVFPSSVVAAAMRIAVSRTWPPTHPHAGDLVDCCTAELRARAAPAAICDVCHGDRFTVTQCDGWHAVNGKAEPVNYQRLCRRDFPHARHEDAHPCRQCHPAARRAEPAA